MANLWVSTSQTKPRMKSNNKSLWLNFCSWRDFKITCHFTQAIHLNTVHFLNDLYAIWVGLSIFQSSFCDFVQLFICSFVYSIILVIRMASPTSSKEHNTTGSTYAPSEWTPGIRALWAPTGMDSQATLKAPYNGTMVAFLCLRIRSTGYSCTASNQ